MDICPFANTPYKEGRFRFTHCEEQNEATQKSFFIKVQNNFLKVPIKEISNYFLIFSQASKDYLKFLDFYYTCEKVLSNNFQLVCFHPQFYFANTAKKARINWVNRAPYPSLHLLRKKEVNDVITHDEMGLQISKANEEKLMNLSETEFYDLTLKWQI